MARTECTARLWLLLALLPACGEGGDNATLTIANEHGSGTGLEITSVLVRTCITRYWEEDAPAFDPLRDRPAEGAITIAPGEAQDLELVPGCHDVFVERAQRSQQADRVALARVSLDAGESAVWVPWLVKENGSWW